MGLALRQRFGMAAWRRGAQARTAWQRPLLALLLTLSIAIVLVPDARRPDSSAAAAMLARAQAHIGEAERAGADQSDIAPLEQRLASIEAEASAARSPGAYDRVEKKATGLVS